MPHKFDDGSENALEILGRNCFFERDTSSAMTVPVVTASVTSATNRIANTSVFTLMQMYSRTAPEQKDSDGVKR